MFFPSNQGAESSSSSCHELTFSEIQVATKNFDESLVIGHGGFGKVYKGTILYGTTLLTVAIKRLDSSSNQGAVEFWAEVKMLSELRHDHLVSLIGYCNEGKEMILVYEYMPNGTLADRLHKRLCSLTWVRRLKICLGAARGLDYLHDDMGIKPIVIHRDVKSSNILIDSNWEAKISDFGLSKVGPTNQQSTSYFNTLVRGTFGYLDPDYFQTGRLTRRSDVYAFGVVLFEVLCGKKAVDGSLDEEQWGLASWAQDSIKKGKLKQIVDPSIRGRISPKCLKKFARLAERCLHSHPRQRPTMTDVVVGLEYIIAYEEKTNKSFESAGMTIFDKMAPTIFSPSKRENSGTTLKSLELYFRTVGGEDRILRRFDFSTINDASENFSNANKISQYIFGSLHKGKLHNGQDIAIVGPYFRTSYELCMNEALILVKLEHENIVQLLGYCIEGTVVYLLYESAPYATLSRLLHDPNGAPFNWDTMYTIILGVARVLVYLHKHVIHCDVKPKNILLDKNLNPKLSGFYDARSIDETDDFRVGGTFGYLAQEVLEGCHVSTKADVFSFGVLVLEAITGRKPLYGMIHERNEMLTDYVWRNWIEGTSSNIIDPRINIDGDSTSIIKFMHIGLLCVQNKATDRPTMEEIVPMMLGSSSTALLVPKEPSLRTLSVINHDSDSHDSDGNDSVSYLSDSDDAGIGR